MGECAQRSLAAAELEGCVWGFVSGLLADPEKVRVGMNRLVEQESTGSGGDPKAEAKVLAERIAGCDRLRSAYQDQQAAGLMTLEELAARLEELELTAVRRATSSIGSGSAGSAEALKRDRDAVIQWYAGVCPKPWRRWAARKGDGSTGCSAWRSCRRPGASSQGALSTSGPGSIATLPGGPSWWTGP